MAFLPVEEQLEIIQRGTTEIVPVEELKEKLIKSLKKNKPLKIKLGVDPTRPDLHLGHSVVLRKLRQFQDLGHEAILIIGGFTAMIGDPTGQNTTRPPLTADEVEENAQSYIDQAKKILDTSRLSIVNNNDWLGPMSFIDVIRLTSKTTVARMIERDDFSKRFGNNEPISLHEFLYPLAQGQDSVHLANDVELGGTDQKFNLLVGRQLQKDSDIEPQICLMMPLLVGTDGLAKMSKSYDNYIGIDENANDMYGKSLSIPDDLIYTYFELVTDVPTEELPAIKEKAEKDPRNAKHDLAFAITKLYHGEEGAKAAKRHFENSVVRKIVSNENLIELPIKDDKINMIDIYIESGSASSRGEAKRMIEQGSNAVWTSGSVDLSDFDFSNIIIPQDDFEKNTDINFEIFVGGDKINVVKTSKRKFVVLKKIND